MIRLLHSVTLILLLSGCANITTPSGGPRDKRAPKLTASIPTNNEINFKGKEVQLTFSEYIKLNNPKEEIIITPDPGKNTEIKSRNYKVIITPENGWQDTTTYSIRFREGIQDITESNSPVNLKLAFSTGPKIDSMSLAGKVEDILRGLPADKITVAIYRQDTFNIFSHTPSYFTRTNKLGQFRLDNIKKGSYKIYAFEDKNKNLKVDSRNERYGFLADKILLDRKIDSLEIGLFQMDSRQLKISSIRNIGTITRVRLNKNAVSYRLAPAVDVVSAFGDKPEAEKQTEIVFWNPGNGSDSLQVHLFATDSLGDTIDSAFYLKRTNIKPIKETFKYSLGKPVADAETGILTTTIKFSKPIVTINTDSLYLEIDTTHSIGPSKKTEKPSVPANKDSVAKALAKIMLRIPIVQKDLTIDELKKEILLTKSLDKNLFSGDKDPRIALKARPSFLLSIDNDTSRTQTIGTLINWPEETGILSVDIRTQEKYFVVQLIDREGKVARTERNRSKYTFKNLPPSEYMIRIIIDTNHNGEWDPGVYKNNIPAEKVIFYQNSEGKKIISIRANWEIEPLIIPI